ncbi:MAG: hypothetical protein M1816_006506 [Peltula sp. TS41687]|nr:MAG: hypothetical protein M1816_006506 [Peltula sp. TS41687]
MNSTPDPSSFAARRSAASNLPNFHLPPPPELPPMQRFSTFGATNLPQSLPVSAGNLLTPPSTVSGDALSPPLSGLNSAGSSGSNPIPPYTPLYWPPTAQAGPPYALGTAQSPHSVFAGQSQVVPARGPYSPSLASMLRRGHTVGECMSSTAPPFDVNNPPFPASMSLSAPPTSAAATLPNLGVQQQAMSQSYLAQHAPASAVTAQLSPIHHHHHAPQDPLFAQRPLPTPSYQHRPLPASAPAHQTTFSSSITASSTMQQSPPLTGSMPKMMPTSPLSHQSSLAHANHGPPPPPLSRALSFSMGTVPAPLMPSFHCATSQMPMVGNLSGVLMPGYAGQGNLAHGYGSHIRAQQAPQPPHNDRPFKCDQCPQSFNRNHDLKRHKRIHLAVKPFPCRHCDKSFSRKDALKRHILVKGCGKTPPVVDTSEAREEGSVSPFDQSRAPSGDDEAGEEAGGYHGGGALQDGFRLSSY